MCQRYTQAACEREPPIGDGQAARYRVPKSKAGGHLLRGQPSDVCDALCGTACQSWDDRTAARTPLISKGRGEARCTSVAVSRRWAAWELTKELGRQYGTLLDMRAKLVFFRGWSENDGDHPSKEEPVKIKEATLDEAHGDPPDTGAPSLISHLYFLRKVRRMQNDQHLPSGLSIHSGKEPPSSIAPSTLRPSTRYTCPQLTDEGYICAIGFFIHLAIIGF